jgi:hypothetical protein
MLMPLTCARRFAFSIAANGDRFLSIPSPEEVCFDPAAASVPAEDTESFDSMALFAAAAAAALALIPSALFSPDDAGISAYAVALIMTAIHAAAKKAVHLFFIFIHPSFLLYIPFIRELLYTNFFYIKYLVEFCYNF